MTKLLHVTNITEPTIFKKRLGEGTQIALKSLSLKATWVNLQKDHKVVVRGYNRAGDTFIVYRGLYRINDIAKIFNDEINKKSLKF